MSRRIGAEQHKRARCTCLMSMSWCCKRHRETCPQNARVATRRVKGGPLQSVGTFFVVQIGCKRGDAEKRLAPRLLEVTSCKINESRARLPMNSSFIRPSSSLDIFSLKEIRTPGIGTIFLSAGCHLCNVPRCASRALSTPTSRCDAEERRSRRPLTPLFTPFTFKMTHPILSHPILFYSARL